MKQDFPRDGSAATPPHPGADFLWKDYCPLAFRQLRRTFAIDAAQYLQSICGAQPVCLTLCILEGRCIMSGTACLRLLLTTSMMLFHLHQPVDPHAFRHALPQGAHVTLH